MGVGYGICSRTVGPVILRAWRVYLEQTGPARCRALCHIKMVGRLREMAAIWGCTRKM